MLSYAEIDRKNKKIDAEIVISSALVTLAQLFVCAKAVVKAIGILFSHADNSKIVGILWKGWIWAFGLVLAYALMSWLVDNHFRANREYLFCFTPSEGSFAEKWLRVMKNISKIARRIIIVLALIATTIYCAVSSMLKFLVVLVIVTAVALVFVHIYANMPRRRR